MDGIGVCVRAIAGPSGRPDGERPVVGIGVCVRGIAGAPPGAGVAPGVGVRPSAGGPAAVCARTAAGAPRPIAVEPAAGVLVRGSGVWVREIAGAVVVRDRGTPASSGPLAGARDACGRGATSSVCVGRAAGGRGPSGTSAGWPREVCGRVTKTSRPVCARE